MAGNETAFRINTGSKVASGPDGDPDQTKSIETSISSAVATVTAASDIPPLLAMLNTYAIAAGDKSAPVTPVGRAHGKVPRSAWDSLRSAAFELHRPEDVILDRETTDTRVIASAIKARLSAGLFDSARAYAAAHNATSQLPPGNKWVDSLKADAINNRVKMPDDQDYLVSRILAAMAIGDVQQADTLAATFQVRPETTVDQFYAVCMAVISARDNALANRLTLQKISNVLENSKSSPSAGFVTLSAIGNASRFLDNSGRIELLSVLQKKAIDAENPAPSKAELKLMLSLAATTGTVNPDVNKWAMSQLTGKDTAESIAGVFLLLPPPYQLDFLNQAVAKMSDAMKLNVYLACVSRANLPLDQATVAGLSDQIAKLAPQDKVYWSGWCYNCAQAEYLGKVADALAVVIPKPAESVQSIAPTVACALALAQSGRTADASTMAMSAIDHLTPWREDSNILNKNMGYFAFEQIKEGDPPPRAYLLQDALSALSPAARHALDDSLTTIANSSTDQNRSTQIPAKLAWESLVRSLVKQSLGQQREALALLTQSYQLDPAEPSILKLYSEWLSAQGYYQKMLATFTDVFNDAPGNRRIAALDIRAAGCLYQMADQYQQTSTQMVAPAPLFALTAAMGDTRKLIQSMDRALQSLRQLDYPNGQMHWEDPPLGGLQAEVTPRTVELLASSSTAMDLLLANWVFPVVRGTPWVKDLLTRGISQGTIDQKSLIEQLAQRASQKCLNDADRDLISILVGQPDVHLPEILSDDAWKAAAFRPTTAQFEFAGKLFDLMPAATGPATESSTQPDPAAVHRHKTLSSPHDSLTLGSLPDPWATSEIQPRPDVDPSHVRQTLNDLLKLGMVSPTLLQFQIRAASLAAEESDWATMQLRVRTAINSWKLQLPPQTVSTDPVLVPAFDHIVPGSFESPRQVVEFSDAIRAELDSAITKWPGESGLVAAYAKIGGQLQAQGYSDQAREFLRSGIAANQSLCEGDQTLCLADLAQRLGDPSLAEQMQIDCLKAGCLPVGRIALVMAKADSATRKSLMPYVPPNLPALIAPVD